MKWLLSLTENEQTCKMANRQRKEIGEGEQIGSTVFHPYYYLFLCYS